MDLSGLSVHISNFPSMRQKKSWQSDSRVELYTRVGWDQTTLALTMYDSMTFNIQ